MMRTNPAPRRTELSRDELAALVAAAGVTLPPGWQPTGSAIGDLHQLDVHPALLVNLAVLAQPAVLVDTTVRIGDLGTRCMHAVTGTLGASLFALPDDGVELSLFAATDLGRELARAAAVDHRPITTILTGGPRPVPRGTVRLAALRELGIARLLSGADPDAVAATLTTLELPPAEAELAEEVSARTDGVLRSVITGRHGPDRVAVGQVTWLHTDAGWVGVDPVPDGSGRQLLRLSPVTAADLGTWAAPALAEVL